MSFKASRLLWIFWFYVWKSFLWTYFVPVSCLSWVYCCWLNMFVLTDGAHPSIWRGSLHEACSPGGTLAQGLWGELLIPVVVEKIRSILLLVSLIQGLCSNAINSTDAASLNDTQKQRLHVMFTSEKRTRFQKRWVLFVFPWVPQISSLLAQLIVSVSSPT